MKQRVKIVFSEINKKKNFFKKMVEENWLNKWEFQRK